MDRLIKILIDRLAGKGLEVTSIPAFIRNLMNSIVDNPYMSLQDLNNRLQLLGWDNVTLDNYTLSIILAVWDSDNSGKTHSLFESRQDKDLRHQIPLQKKIGLDGNLASPGW